MSKRELAIFSVLFVLDILTKSMMENVLLSSGSIPVIENFFYLTSVHNTGAAWGMFSGKQEIFFIAAILVVGVIIYFMFDNKISSKWSRFSMTLILAGTLGNLFDRIVYGYVRDFLDFYIFGYDYPVFNFADCCLVVGFFILAIQIIWGKEEW